MAPVLEEGRLCGAQRAGCNSRVPNELSVKAGQQNQTVGVQTYPDRRWHHSCAHLVIVFDPLQSPVLVQLMQTGDVVTGTHTCSLMVYTCLAVVDGRVFSSTIRVHVFIKIQPGCRELHRMTDLLMAESSRRLSGCMYS